MTTLMYEGLFVVEPQRRSGGLALIWKESTQAEFVGFSQHHVDVKVNIDGMNAWNSTEVYEEPKRTQRRRTWDLLRSLARDSNLTWPLNNCPGRSSEVFMQQDRDK
ncbi:hypothetical protein POM88_012579 [Heracleum sosnowskyi]|uniref:Uncharacterized protein n=1 Tax=Heracleum sosnowskyi TaxID=360622 RepID=A0AAD8IYX9_9APIA|nr:hypothetical protein POM88_012579 [Heracleum sosnowskyi]